MQKIICPQCKSDTSFNKDRLCSSNWRCPICDICCISEKNLTRRSKQEMKAKEKQIKYVPQ